MIAIFNLNSSEIRDSRDSITTDEDSSFSSRSLFLSSHSGMSSPRGIEDILLKPEGTNSTNCSALKFLCDGSNSRIFSGRLGHRCVIVKTLKTSKMSDANAIKELKREATVLRKFCHPNIVRMFGTGSNSFGATVPSLIMEFIHGGTLAAIIHKNPLYFYSTVLKSGLPLFLQSVTEIADALTYLHSKFSDKYVVLHRDIKPDNLCLTDDGHIKLIDFGLCACVRRDQWKSEGYNLTGCTGSLRYMAPEVAQRTKYNEKVDIYSFGILMYQLLTGLVPFSHKNRHEFIVDIAVHHERPVFPVTAFDDQSSSWRTAARGIIEQCWSHHPNDRPSADCLLLLFRELAGVSHGECWSEEQIMHGDDGVDGICAEGKPAVPTVVTTVSPIIEHARAGAIITRSPSIAPVSVEDSPHLPRPSRTGRVLRNRQARYFDEEIC